MELKFKKWLESIFGQAVVGDWPASIDAEKANPPTPIDLEPLPGNKKAMKKQKKQTKN